MSNTQVSTCLRRNARKVTQFWPNLGLTILVEGIPKTEDMYVMLVGQASYTICSS